MIWPKSLRKKSDIPQSVNSNIHHQHHPHHHHQSILSNQQASSQLKIKQKGSNKL